ncbi:DUF418 domain-containing protein [Mesobacillus zeae]|uniref:DUF418 domain-containing protein n=1 Tax=Mesobacillus zeae TaxID=1917180 RepID=A0A398B3V4_9BACI|nr:DUF418 domain-containing protein [Mesobacillus zeae]RID84585.1 DUF418 domain-containing protein [Mesobacillus zeae]
MKIDGGRVVSIDMMRGFSLLGILLVNMMSFHTPILYIDGQKWWESGLDKAVYFFIDVFVQGSFYPLFAFVFGYSLTIMMERSGAKGMAFYPVALRRFSVMLMLGALHVVLVWHGDILFTYAVCGFLLLAFIRLSAKKLVWSGVLIYLVPNLLLCLLFVAVLLISPAEMVLPVDKEAVKLSVETYSNGSFAEISAFRVKDWFYTNNPGAFFMYFITILPLFMIGAGAAKLKLFENVENYRRKMAAAAGIMFLAGLAFKLLPFTAGNNLLTVYIQDLFGGPLQAFSYAGFIALAGNMGFLRPLTAAGKISLTNYLCQSVIGSFIFYGYGLGLYGSISLFKGTMLAIILFGIQLAFSVRWTKRFYYGPVEWLLRAGSYWAAPKWRKERSGE